MARKSSSGRWKQRQARDPFVRRAQAAGWRSRAAFKLMEIDDRDRVLRRGASVLDLGAAPGGWSQVAAARVGPGGRVIAVDLLDMAPIDGVSCIRGDFGDEAILQTIGRELGPTGADVVLSDMAPNISGNWSVDQPRSMGLAEEVLAAAGRLLRPGGSMIVKVFQGEGFEDLVRRARAAFDAVRIRKPAASRSESREMYLVAVNRRLV
ncbi:MAG: RlmE family RNA methyltransferase [Gammaproteobacteria bacterium]|nr:RlmE family RNA methyltransferase [Gammaproteobacteria bacterium]